MPRASGADVERWLQDHDTDEVSEAPPVQNTWYEVFHAYDVRLLWCVYRQVNDETAAKDVAVRWTIDGNVYYRLITALNNTFYFTYRNWLPSTGGTAGLTTAAGQVSAGDKVDKRGLDFKVEIRMTSVPGTNQTLDCYCVRETQEIT